MKYLHAFTSRGIYRIGRVSARPLKLGHMRVVTALSEA